MVYDKVNRFILPLLFLHVPYQQYYTELAYLLCIALHGHSIDVNADNKKNRTKEVGLLIGSLGHAALLFVNKQPAGKPLVQLTFYLYRICTLAHYFTHVMQELLFSKNGRLALNMQIRFICSLLLLFFVVRSLYETMNNVIVS